MNARKMCAEQTRFDWVQAKISRELFANQKILSEEDSVAHSVEVKWVFFWSRNILLWSSSEVWYSLPIAFSLSRLIHSLDSMKRRENLQMAKSFFRSKTIAASQVSRVLLVHFSHFQKFFLRVFLRHTQQSGWINLNMPFHLHATRFIEF